MCVIVATPEGATARLDFIPGGRLDRRELTIAGFGHGTATPSSEARGIRLQGRGF